MDGVTTVPDSGTPPGFSDASLDLAGRLLRELLTEPNQRERIDALAAAANALFALREQDPDLWRKTTTHGWTGRVIA